MVAAWRSLTCAVMVQLIADLTHLCVCVCVTYPLICSSATTDDWKFISSPENRKPIPGIFCTDFCIEWSHLGSLNIHHNYWTLILSSVWHHTNSSVKLAELLSMSAVASAWVRLSGASVNVCMPFCMSVRAVKGNGSSYQHRGWSTYVHTPWQDLGMHWHGGQRSKVKITGLWNDCTFFNVWILLEKKHICVLLNSDLSNAHL